MQWDQSPEDQARVDRIRLVLDLSRAEALAMGITGAELDEVRRLQGRLAREADAWQELAASFQHRATTLAISEVVRAMATCRSDLVAVERDAQRRLAAYQAAGGWLALADDPEKWARAERRLARGGFSPQDPNDRDN